jgi:hypothetical protein
MLMRTTLSPAALTLLETMLPTILIGCGTNASTPDTLAPPSDTTDTTDTLTPPDTTDTTARDSETSGPDLEPCEGSEQTCESATVVRMCMAGFLFRIDCETFLPTPGVCVEGCANGVCDRTNCAVKTGDRCLYDEAEWQPPDLPEPIAHLDEGERGDVLLNCEDYGGCLVGDDGVGRCARDIPRCDYVEQSRPPFYGIGACVGTTQVLACRGWDVGTTNGGYTVLARSCENEDACGTTCSGMPDGSSCNPDIVFGGRLFPISAISELPIGCGPYSRCDPDTERCTPRVCSTSTASGACTNPSDCGILDGNLPAVEATVLECLADPAPFSCVIGELGLSYDCANCFLDLDGDLEACIGF